MLEYVVVNEDMKKIRVRFAPSPTGHLHVGGARTALYNWLLARGSGGTFVLRIEDTDLSRSTDEHIEQIITSMGWLGLDWDEGPNQGGEYGPYRQMERMDLYRAAADELLASGNAYKCYCTAAEIDADRELTRAEGRSYIYSGRCRGLTSAEAAALAEEGHSPVIRLKSPTDGFTVVRDMIRGDVSFENALVGDTILVRSSGVPTYNFAVAVDDTHMRISHVIRGDDHLPNTPRQLHVMTALGAEPPVYAHLPLILGSDRAPLSKRHGSSSLDEFRSQGFVREALCNYLALLGWSYDAETTLFSISELKEKFSLDRVNSTAAVFDNDKLLWMNGQYLRAMPEEELAARVEEFLRGTPLAELIAREDTPRISDLIPMVWEKMKTLVDFAVLTDFFFLPFEFQEKALAKLKRDENATRVLTRVAMILDSVEVYGEAEIEQEIRVAADQMEIKLGKFLQPIRIAVSGRMVTPGMFEMLVLLGRDTCISRIAEALKVIEQP
ncbi:MAG: glutamate--tRNA ligase [Thermoleophilia bacterium]